MSSWLSPEKSSESLGLMNASMLNNMNAWGPLFFFAYGASGFWQFVNRRSPYWHNHFEVQARERSNEHHPSKVRASSFH